MWNNGGKAEMMSAEMGVKERQRSEMMRTQGWRMIEEHNAVDKREVMDGQNGK